MQNCPFKVILGEGCKPQIQVEWRGDIKIFHPEEILLMILTKMKTITETYFKEQYTDVVITVPSNFNDLQRELIKDIAIISGFKVLCVLSELSAASLTSGLNEKCNITFR